MKRLLLSLLFCGASAFATNVTYYTSASFSGPDAVGAGNSLASGAATLTYTPVPSTTVGPTPTNINIGTIDTLGNGTFVGDSVVLSIWQTDPTPGGSQSSSSTIDGTVTSTSNGIDILFAPASFTIASNPSVSYVLQDSYFLVAPNTNGGMVSLQAAISSSTDVITRGANIPEPASVGLMGGALLGLGLWFADRRVRKSFRGRSQTYC